MGNTVDKTPQELASLLDQAERSLRSLGKDIQKAGEERTEISDSESLSGWLSFLANISFETADVIDRITRRLPTSHNELSEMLQTKLSPISAASLGPRQEGWYISVATSLAYVVECSKFVLSQLDRSEDFCDLFRIEAQLKVIFHVARAAEGNVTTADFLRTNPRGHPPPVGAAPEPFTDLIREMERRRRLP